VSGRSVKRLFESLPSEPEAEEPTRAEAEPEVPAETEAPAAEEPAAEEAAAAKLMEIVTQ